MSRLDQAEFKVTSFCALGAICAMVVSGSAAGDESRATVPPGYSTSRTGSLHDFDYFGRLDPVPVVGGFQGNRGEFYAADHDNGRPVKVRYTWEIRDRDHARWEQAFSYDERSWETNWTADFERADPLKTCTGGRPKR